MASQNCSSLRDALVSSFANELEVSATDRFCVVTLPLRTADDRFVDVFVEPMLGSNVFMYVHDGGKNTAELWAQGVHRETDTQMRRLKGIADAYGATFHEGRFQILCKNQEEIESAIISIGQCASLAMIDVVTHVPNIQDEALLSRVFKSLNAWKPSYVEIKRRVTASGKTYQFHRFDFVSVPAKARKRTVAVKVLPPSVGTSWQVARYGFLALDLAGREAGDWPRLAIVSKAEEWSDGALEAIRTYSADIITLKTEEESQLERILPHKMQRLTDAA
jgi:hypothetical protein